MSEKKVMKAFEKLQKAKDKFNQAIVEFNEVYSPNSVGLDEWIEHNEEVMSDLETDIQSEFGEEFLV